MVVAWSASCIQGQKSTGCPTRASSRHAPLRSAAQVKRKPLGADGWNVENVIFVLPAGSVARRGGSPAGVTFGDGREGQGDLSAIPARAAARTGHWPWAWFCLASSAKAGVACLRSRLYGARVSRPNVSLLPGAGWPKGQSGWPAVAGPGVTVIGQWVFRRWHFARCGAITMLECDSIFRALPEGRRRAGR